MYRLTTNPNSVMHLPSGAIFPMPPTESYGHDYQAWLAAGNTPEPAPLPPTPTQFELDERRYARRAAVKDSLVAYMAADNMSRVRSGAWTVADLTSLMADPAVTAAQAYMSTLSYELAAQAITQATTPLLTQSIKDVWISKLTEHFYLVP
jgi:hypothetical protein